MRFNIHLTPDGQAMAVFDDMNSLRRAFYFFGEDDYWVPLDGGKYGIRLHAWRVDSYLDAQKHG